MSIETKRRELNVDDAIERVGEFGLAQKIQTTLCGVCWAIASFQTVIILFQNLGPQKSSIQCIHANNSTNNACEDALHTSNTPALCTLSRDSWKWNTFPGYSIISEFDLICDNTFLAYLASSIFFVGTLVGSMSLHIAAEQNGRRRLLYLSCCASGIAGCLAATAPSYWMFIAFRCIAGMAAAAICASAFILASDITGRSWRPFSLLFMQGGFSFGAVCACITAWLVPSWRWLTVVASLLPLVFLATTWSLLIESPQWLLLHGRKGEATAALAAIAFTNRTNPPAMPLADPTSLLANPYRGAVDLLRNGRLRQRTLLLSVAWFCVSCAYYLTFHLADVMRGADEKHDGPSTLELATTGFAYELPAVAAAGLAAERLGRKYAAIGGFVQAGASLLIAAVLPGGAAQRACAVASRFGLACGWSALSVLSWEMFPVVVQHPGLLLTNYAARIASVIAPWLAFASATMLRLPSMGLLLSAVLCSCAAFSTSLLPETLNGTIPETIQDFNACAVRKHRSSWAHLLVRGGWLKSGGVPVDNAPLGAIVVEGDRCV